MGTRIFVSYRRSDSSHVAGRLRDRLVDVFHASNVFYDVDSIAFGADFRDVIARTLVEVDIVLVVIGPNWDLDRLQLPNDYVRLEIAESIRQGKLVVPVLLDGASIPSTSQLPVELERLPFLNAAPLRRDPDFRTDTARIVEFIRAFSRMPENYSSNLPRTGPAMRQFREGLRDGTVNGPAAMTDLDEFLRRDPSDTWALVSRASVRELFLSDFYGSEGDCGEAIRINPDFSLAYAFRANARKAKGDIDAAIEDYDEALRLDPGNDGVYCDRGNARQTKGDIVAAIGDYNESIRLNGSHPAPYYCRAHARKAQGNLDDAISDYTEAIRLDPTDPWPYYDRGNARQVKGDLGAAISDYSEAIRLNPTLGFAYNNRGRARQINGDTDAAIEDHNEAIRLSPADPLARCLRGRARLTLGDLDAAISDYTEAIRLDPTLAVAYRDRGHAREAKGLLELAKADFEECRRLEQKA